ncbi:MAG: hypothetical protein M9894_34640 [Planctomycetes bacterium]|nr:hypothetical protein [Planctomycetota bacterium]
MTVRPLLPGPPAAPGVVAAAAAAALLLAFALLVPPFHRPEFDGPLMRAGTLTVVGLGLTYLVGLAWLPLAPRDRPPILPAEPSRRRLVAEAVAPLAVGVLVWAPIAALDGTGWLVLDDGPVQGTTLVLLLSASVVCARRAWVDRVGRVDHALLAWVFLVYAAREHEMHAPRFLAEHVAKPKFFRSAAVPGEAKVVVAILLAAVGLVLVAFLARNLRRGVGDLARGRAWAVLTVVWAVTLLTSQVIDRTWLDTVFWGQALEEVLEGVAAAYVLLVACRIPSSGAEAYSTSSTNRLAT